MTGVSDDENAMSVGGATIGTSNDENATGATEMLAAAACSPRALLCPPMTQTVSSSASWNGLGVCWSSTTA